MAKSKDNIRLSVEAAAALKQAYSSICTVEELGPATMVTYRKAISCEWVNKGCYRGLLVELNRIKGANELRSIRAANDSLWGGVYAK
jgi:hypothetical protein